MKLFQVIDGLLKGTRYLAWGIGVAGIVMSAMLILVNISLGFTSAIVFLAAFLLAIAVTILLMPQQFEKGILESNKKYCIGTVALVLAVVIMGIVWIYNGGFPEVNLIFI